MTSLGWSENSGIAGSDLTGNPNHIAVARKLDNSGIGIGRVRKEGEENSAGAGQAGRGLEDVLKRLAQASTPTLEAKFEGDVGNIAEEKTVPAAAMPHRMALVIRCLFAFGR